MKSINVPFIKGLAQMNGEELLTVMEQQAARGYIEHANWPNLFPYKPIAVFDVARSEDHIFISYFVKGLDLKAVHTIDNDPVWQDSCVEFFVKDPTSNLYYNFEFNCAGVCLASKRTCPDDRVFLSPAELGSIIRYPSVTESPVEEREGIFAWQLIVGIPFEAFGFTSETLPKHLRANFFKCGDETSHPHYLSWSPITFERPNFHLPEFFGELVL
jgi:hypothetical protein